ncbi:MAG: hypothetical protein LBN74_10590, partial [Prevotella sp.]|nr:hypothetical protein [Prevotella sp.]
EIVEYLLENKANPNVYIKQPPYYKHVSTLLSFVKGHEYNSTNINYIRYGLDVMGPLLEKYGAKKKF